MPPELERVSSEVAPVTADFGPILAVIRAAVDMPAPEAHDEEDGDLGLDWDFRHCSLTVHVSPNGRIGWAALIGYWRAHGHCFSVPDAQLLDAMHRWKDYDDGAATRRTL